MNNNELTFTDNQLGQVLAFFKVRSKALKHKIAKITFSKELENGFERLNIDCESFASPPYQIRLSLWNDREIYYRTCQSSKIGWRHNVGLAGNIGKLNPKTIEKRFEASLYLTEQEELKEIWPELTIEED